MSENTPTLDGATVLRRGDTVLLTIPDIRDVEQMSGIREQLEDWFPGITFRLVAPVSCTLVQHEEG